VIGGNDGTDGPRLFCNYFGGPARLASGFRMPCRIMEDQRRSFLISPQHAIQRTIRVRISSYIINFNNESNTYNFGPTIAKDITDDLSAGLTLYYYQRKALWILNQIIKTDNGGYELTNQYYHSDESGFRPVLGFMWSPVKNVSIGLALSKVFIESSDTDVQVSYNRAGIYTSPTDSQDVSLPGDPSNPSYSTSAKRKMPKQISLGLAWFPSQSLLITTDFNYFSAKSVRRYHCHGWSCRFRHRDVLNIALGTEYYFSRNWAMRGILYGLCGRTPRGIADNANEHIDLYGGR
jgi:long-subunit fatty acid transport protein